MPSLVTMLCTLSYVTSEGTKRLANCSTVGEAKTVTLLKMVTAGSLHCKGSCSLLWLANKLWGGTVQFFKINFHLWFWYPLLILSQMDKLSHHLMPSDDRSGYRRTKKRGRKVTLIVFYYACHHYYGYTYCYLLQPNKLCQGIVTSNDCPIVSHSICGSEIWEVRGWVLLTWGISDGWRQTGLELEMRETVISGGWPDIFISLGTLWMG